MTRDAISDAVRGSRQLSRREFLRTGTVAGLGALAVGLSALRNPHQFDLTQLTAAIRGLNEPLRISFLTDLHLGPYLGAADLEAWVEVSNAERPDLVLLGGDTVDQRYRGDLSELRKALQSLTAPLGAYAVLGNHDRTRFRNVESLRGALAAGGVELLVNQGILVRDDLFLAGIDDLRLGSASVGDALARAPSSERSADENADAGPATILISHNPDIIAELPPDYGAVGIDLLLAGHTHGGQIRIPGLGPLVTSSKYGARYASGWVPAPFPAFVSRGLGVTALPFRFACPAELVILDLQPAV